MEQKRYEIGGRTFFQQPLSCGQAEHVAPLIESLGTLDLQKKDLGGALHTLSAPLYRLLALVLIPEGETRGAVVRRADMPGGTQELEGFFREELEPKQIEEIISDFLAYSPLTSTMGLLARLFSVGTAAGERPTPASTSTPTMPSPPAGQA